MTARSVGKLTGLQLYRRVVKCMHGDKELRDEVIANLRSSLGSDPDALVGNKEAQFLADKLETFMTSYAKERTAPDNAALKKASEMTNDDIRKELMERSMQLLRVSDVMQSAPGSAGRTH